MIYCCGIQGARTCWKRTVAHEETLKPMTALAEAKCNTGAGAEMPEENQTLVTQTLSEGSRRCHSMFEWEKRDSCGKRRWWAEPVNLIDFADFHFCARKP